MLVGREVDEGRLERTGTGLDTEGESSLVAKDGGLVDCCW